MKQLPFGALKLEGKDNEKISYNTCRLGIHDDGFC